MSNFSFKKYEKTLAFCLVWMSLMKGENNL